MRKGQNPSKDSLPAYRPERLGIAIVSYIPSMAGYFEHSLEVLKYEIASIHRATQVGFDLYVFDNGSCAEAKAALHQWQADGWVDFLFSSLHNLGKIGAINWILGAVPNELICYTDSDVLFRPSWFEKSSAILEAFPEVGLVSAQPCLDDVLQAKGKAQTRFDDDPAYQVTTQVIDPKWVDEYATGFGYTVEQADTLKNNLYKVVTHRQSLVRAVVGATHVQFLMPRAVARQVVPLPSTMSLSRKEDFNLNQAVDQKGYLHLSTLEPYYYHMGNTLDENVHAEIQRMNLEEIFQTPIRQEKATGGSWLIRLLKKMNHFRIFRSLIYRSYKMLFELYS